VQHHFTHSGEHPYTCDMCNKAFSDRGSVIGHQLVYSGERPYTCNMCNEACSRKMSRITVNFCRYCDGGKHL
jgi:hypothetical protein